MQASADDIDIIGVNKRNVCSAFSKSDREPKRVGMVVNVEKKIYLWISKKQSAHTHLGAHVPVDSYDFEKLDDLVYLGSSINNNNNISLDIQRRITLTNKAFARWCWRWRWARSALQWRVERMDTNAPVSKVYNAKQSLICDRKTSELADRQTDWLTFLDFVKFAMAVTAPIRRTMTKEKDNWLVLESSLQNIYIIDFKFEGKLLHLRSELERIFIFGLIG